MSPSTARGAGGSSRSRCPDCDNPIGPDDYRAGECAACGYLLERPSSIVRATDRLIGDRDFELPDAPTASRYIRYVVIGAIALFIIAHLPLVAPRWVLNEPALIAVPCADPCPIPLKAGILQVKHSMVIASRLSPLAENTVYLALRSSDDLNDLDLTLQSGSGPRVTLARRDDSAFWSVSGARGSGAIALDVAGTIYVPLTLDPPLGNAASITIGSDSSRSTSLPVQHADGALGALQPSGAWLLFALLAIASLGFLRCGPKLLWSLAVCSVSGWLATVTVTVGSTRILNTVGSYASEPNYPGLLVLATVTIVFSLTAGAPLALIGAADRVPAVSDLQVALTDRLSSPARRLFAKGAAGILALIVTWLVLDVVGYGVELLLPGWTI